MKRDMDRVTLYNLRDEHVYAHRQEQLAAKQQELLNNQFEERDACNDNSRNNSALTGSHDSAKRVEAMERSNPAYNEGLIEYPIPAEKSRSSKKKNENIDS